jgi:hypothetical protein
MLAFHYSRCFGSYFSVTFLVDKRDGIHKHFDSSLYGQVLVAVSFAEPLHEGCNGCSSMEAAPPFLHKTPF